MSVQNWDGSSCRLGLTWMAGRVREKPPSTRCATETLEIVEISRNRSFVVCPGVTPILSMKAGVATLLMCCQSGEVDQTLSLFFLQLLDAPSHTSACLNGLAGSLTSECIRANPPTFLTSHGTGHENSSMLSSKVVGYAMRKQTWRAM